MMGVKMSVNWIVNYELFAVEYVSVVLVMWLAGAAIGLAFFTLHSNVIMTLFFVAWGNVFISFSMFLVVFFSRTRAAMAVAAGSASVPPVAAARP